MTAILWKSGVSKSASQALTRRKRTNSVLIARASRGRAARQPSRNSPRRLETALGRVTFQVDIVSIGCLAHVESTAKTFNAGWSALGWPYRTRDILMCMMQMRKPPVKNVPDYGAVPSSAGGLASPGQVDRNSRCRQRPRRRTENLVTTGAPWEDFGQNSGTDTYGNAYASPTVTLRQRPRRHRQQHYRQRPAEQPSTSEATPARTEPSSLLTKGVRRHHTNLEQERRAANNAREAKRTNRWE